jgi:hypothetical protein
VPVREPATGDDASRQSEHKDIAHPITAECREYIQKKILEAYDIEKKKGASARPAQGPAQQEARPAPRAQEPDEDNDIEL